MSEAAQGTVQHEAPRGFLSRWVFSRDHKVIGLQYIVLALVAGLFGTLLSVLMRFHLSNPAAALPLLETVFPNGAPDGVMSPELYLALVTMHGTIMVFFVLTVIIQNGFGNYFLPLQIGADDMAFPTLNMLSFWIALLSFLVMISAVVFAGGGPISGWTAYPPLSALGELAGPGLGLGQVIWIVSIALFCIASVMGSLNFIVTTIQLRTAGMTMMRLPLTVWAWFVTGVMALIAFAVLLAAGLLLLLDHVAGTAFFIPAGLIVSDVIIERGGGSPILFQHLLWFFGHPEVYIIIVPALGVVSHLLAVGARKPVFCYKPVIVALTLLSTLGFVVWGHHMFVSGMSPFSAVPFSMLTIAISIPAGAIAISWPGTLWGGRIRFDAPTLFAIGFISYFVTGGLGGLFLGQTGLDLYLHDTYFVVGHFHVIMGMSAMLGAFAATYHWFPKMTGRLMHDGLARAHFWLTFIFGYLVFIGMHLQGLAGHPRRYPDTLKFDFLQELQSTHEFISVCSYVLAGAQLLIVGNMIWSFFKGKRADRNPWQATTLEWVAATPPPHGNFEGPPPTVKRWAYEYGVDGERDYVMQDE